VETRRFLYSLYSSSSTTRGVSFTDIPLAGRVLSRFLWKTSSVIPDPLTETDEDDLPEVDVFRWTGRNDYVALCEPDSVTLGGG
jgi:hypothetical protein